MSLKNQIVVKTDASTCDGEGCGVAYQATVHDGFGVKEHHDASSFISQDLKTTEAEAVAVLFALKKLNFVFKNLRDDYRKDYLIIIKSDCENTINRVENEMAYTNIDDYIQHYLRFFGNFRARWIPRESNVEVDQMARNMFHRGIDDG